MLLSVPTIPGVHLPLKCGAMTILITGGTGKTGSRVTHRLTQLGHSVRAVTRHSEPAFDWHDDSTWGAAITGCAAAFVTYQPDLGLPDADAVIGAFARRAVDLGCTRLVLLSGRGEDGARRSEARVDRGRRRLDDFALGLLLPEL